MKILRKFAFVFSFIAFSIILSPLFSQNQKIKIGMGLNIGLEAGWWIYNKGFNDTLPGSHLGYDRTHLSFVTPLEISFALKHASWYVNLGVGITRIGDDVMIGSEDQRRGRTRYDISSNAYVSSSKVFLKGGLAIVKKNKYSLFPSLELGFFNLQTTHPDRGQFHRKYLWRISFDNYIHQSELLDLVFSPTYSNLTISTNEQANQGSKHNIYSIGLNIGAFIWLK